MSRHRFRQEEKLEPTCIRAWREFRGLTQDELIARLPDDVLSKASLSRIENGLQVYTQDILQLIARVLDVTVVDLLARRPGDPEGIWSIVSRATPEQQRKIAAIAKALLRAEAGED